MPFSITKHEFISPHEWAIAIASCDLEDDNDLLLKTTINLVRTSYGENILITNAETLMSEAIENGTYNLEHLKAAVREGFPNPASEGNKPKQLTTYRSQTAEMVAKGALAKAYLYQYPAAPQAGAANPNQPILGFDGWGILKVDEDCIYLALIQVKATDVDDSPPSDANKLAQECSQAPKDRSAICRALSLMAVLMRGDPLQAAIYNMLEKMGKKESIPILVSPAIVRGITKANRTDLDPVFDISNEILPASLRAIIVSIGVCLDEFGYRVMNKAREIS
ncbi:MAG: hypothetical protein PHQ40_00565 [Anaerolineaceae bacterium]|nr:hypothetical protein [Anaerolineaceae bacterium]